MELKETSKLLSGNVSSPSVEPRRRSMSMSRVKSGIKLSALGNSNNAASSNGSSKVLQSKMGRVLLTGSGFLADAYSLFVINMVLRLLRDEYPDYDHDKSVHILEGIVAASALIGAIIGQLVSGLLADIFGRKKLFVCTALLIAIGSIGSSCSIDLPYLNIYYQIACWRFLLGLGVGGEYPLAAALTSESSSAESRGQLMVSVFSCQGIGSLLSTGIVMSTLSAGISNAIAWRAALAFGAIPVLIAFPWRLRMHETESFDRIKEERETGSTTLSTSASTSTSMNNNTNNISSYNNHNHYNSKSDSNSNSNSMFGHWSSLKNFFKLYKWHLFGTSFCWFLLDFNFYANGLFNIDIITNVLKQDINGAMDDARYSFYIALIGFPGYILSYLYIDKIGRKNIQLIGFVMTSLLFWSCYYINDHNLIETSSLSTSTPSSGIEIFNVRINISRPMIFKTIYVICYSFTFLFSNFGPNTLTFVIPGEIFPVEVRATANGIASACGKLGAAAGAFIFPYIKNVNNSMYLCSVIAALGAIITYFFIPTYDSYDLNDDDTYISLDYDCLKPVSEWNDDDIYENENVHFGVNGNGNEIEVEKNYKTDVAMHYTQIRI